MSDALSSLLYGGPKEMGIDTMTYGDLVGKVKERLHSLNSVGGPNYQKGLQDLLSQMSARMTKEDALELIQKLTGADTSNWANQVRQSVVPGGEQFPGFPGEHEDRPSLVPGGEQFPGEPDGRASLVPGGEIPGLWRVTTPLTYPKYLSPEKATGSATISSPTDPMQSQDLVRSLSSIFASTPRQFMR